MRNVLRLNEPRGARPVWLSASAVALAALVAGLCAVLANHLYAVLRNEHPSPVRCLNLQKSAKRAG